MKQIRRTLLHLYFCVFQRELVLITSHIYTFLELLHISLAPARKLNYYSYMSNSAALLKVMLLFVYFTNIVNTWLLEGEASGF